jgi:hypothetical protein
VQVKIKEDVLCSIGVQSVKNINIKNTFDNKNRLLVINKLRYGVFLKSFKMMRMREIANLIQGVVFLDPAAFILLNQKKQ